MNKKSYLEDLIEKIFNIKEIEPTVLDRKQRQVFYY